MSTAPQRKGAPKHVVCLSWIPSLARTRELMLTDAGWQVTSLLGAGQLELVQTVVDPDLLVLAHSVPRNEKRRAIGMFREHCASPVLSLLEPYASKLPEADFGVEAIYPAAVVDAVSRILRTK